jgi:hypothetical protein
MIKKKNYFFLTILATLIMLLYFFIKSENTNIRKFADKEISSEKNDGEEIIVQNNLIKKLSYFSKDINNNSYNISAEYGVFINNSNKIEMTEPYAKIISNSNKIITITSNTAIYDQQNYDTKFTGNVIIKFENKEISASFMDINFTSNYLNIYDNVIYTDPIRSLHTENISLNLLTGDILINSNNKNKTVNFITTY